MRTFISLRWLVVAAIAPMLLALACSSADPAPAPASDAVTKEELAAALQEAMQSVQPAPAAPAPAPAGPSAEEMAAMVEAAVQGAVPEGTSAEEIKAMVEAAVGAASQDAITADQVRTLVAEAVAESATEGPDPLSADEVRQIVSAAVSALPTPEARVVTKEVKVTEVKEVQIPGKKYVTDPTTNKVIPAPEYGGTIIRLQTNQPPHTDTYFTHHAANGTDGVTESLAHADWGIDRSVFDHMKRPTPLWVMKGQLATGWVQNDPLTYTINIRDDVYWHNKAPMDGRKMTAQDVAWNFQRYLHLGDEYADQEGPCCTFKSVKWESVTATDDNTVVFKLEEPNIDTLTILFTSYSPHILPPEVVQEHGDIQDWRNLVGTGPFMLTDWVDGSSMTWEKNPDYWGTDEKFPENQLPYADATRVLIMKDEATRIAAMRTGKGDYMGWLANSAISTTDQAEALVKTNPDISLIPYAYRSTTSTAFDVDKPPFDDVRVRRAMQMALDLDTINTIYYKGWATVEPMGQIGTGAIEYVTPFNEWPEDIKPYYEYNPEGAVALLEEAGYTPDENGVRISGSSVFHATSDLALADIFVDYWRRVGIDIEAVKGPDNTTVGTWIREHTYPHDMVGSAIMGYDRSPITILRAFIHSEGGYNYTGVRDPEFDAMIEAAEAASTYEERQQIIKDLDIELSRQHLYVWGMKAQAFNAVQPWLIGYNGEYHLGLQQRFSQLFARFWLDQELKAQSTN